MELDLARHDADLECVVRALDTGPTAGRREELTERLRRTPFLIGENAATGEQRLLMPPPGLYQRSKELEVYFEGNRNMRVRGQPLRAVASPVARDGRTAGRGRPRADPEPARIRGHHRRVRRNERGLGGFDPDAEIDSLDFRAAPPWPRPFGIRLERPARPEPPAGGRRGGDIGPGVVRRRQPGERQVGDRGRRGARGLAAQTGQGRFHRPAELSLDDLPPTYTRDEGLAQALGMLQPVVAQAARRLGIAPEVLWGSAAKPDLVAMVEAELRGQDGRDVT